MYDEIGKKIKGLATVICILGICVMLIMGMMDIILGIIESDGEKVLFGLIVGLLGSVGVWVSTWVLYGFGELIDKVGDIATCLKTKRSPSQRGIENVPDILGFVEDAADDRENIGDF